MAIEIVDFPIKNGGSFHSYVKLPEGIRLKRVTFSISATPKTQVPLITTRETMSGCCFFI